MGEQLSLLTTPFVPEDAPALAEDEDRGYKKPRMAAEYSFNLVVSKFKYSDYFGYDWILEQGKS